MYTPDAMRTRRELRNAPCVLAALDLFWRSFRKVEVVSDDESEQDHINEALSPNAPSAHRGPGWRRPLVPPASPAPLLSGRLGTPMRAPLPSLRLPMLPPVSAFVALTRRRAHGEPWLMVPRSEYLSVHVKLQKAVDDRFDAEVAQAHAEQVCGDAD